MHGKRQRDPSWEGPGNRPYGDRVGEDPSTVVAAFKEAGSYDGAARLLNAREVPTRGPGMWHGTTVRDLVKREAPDLIPPGVTRGTPAGRGDFRLARLLRCSVCGGTMSPSLDKRRDEVRYYCHGARVTPHGRGWVSESRVIEHVAYEAKRAAIFTRRFQKGSAQDEAALVRLAAKRARILENFDDGHYDKATRDARLAIVAEAESKLSARRWVRRHMLAPVVAAFIDRDGNRVEASPPGRVNVYLRRLFRSITVDMSQPTKRGPSSWVPSLAFDWSDPEMRRHDPDEEQGHATRYAPSLRST